MIARSEGTRCIGAEQERLAALRQVLIAGRWALLIAELTTVALRFERVRALLPAEIALIALLVYNAIALWALHRFPPGRIPIPLFLAADLLTVGGLIIVTEGLRSPFASLLYFVVLVGAIQYGVPGGLFLAGIASALLLAASSLTPDVWEAIVQGEARTQMLPNLLLVGAFAGYLVRQANRLHRQHAEIETQLQLVEHEAELRRREADLARDVQRAALADPAPHPHLTTAVRFEPIGAVGGDFYAFTTAGQRMGVFLGDVSGKGLPAALTATSVAHLIYTMGPMEDAPAFLDTLNRTLLDQLPDEVFVTMVFALLDPISERAVIYSAGHPPPLLLRGARLERIQNRGMALGVTADLPFAPKVIRYRPGETLVLYSDGFIEACSPDDRRLSVEGLEGLIQQQYELPPAELADRLIADTRAFGEVRDDLTLVVVRSNDSS
jgi:sigma-B regulation protein RsbU (phosphoserine phosphatase)